MPKERKSQPLSTHPESICIAHGRRDTVSPKVRTRSQTQSPRIYSISVMWARSGMRFRMIASMIS